MIEKAREIALKLASFEDVWYEHLSNSTRFKLISKTGVKWSSKAYKLGNIHYYNDHLYLALDYPIGELSESEVIEKLNLPLKNPGDKKSGFYIKQAKNKDKFDTVRVSLYQDELSDLNLIYSSIINFAVDIFNKSKR